MKHKTRLAILYGGKSSEHEVSLQSARNIIDAVDKNKYELILIRIDKNGVWYLNSSHKLTNNSQIQQSKFKSSRKVALIPSKTSNELINISEQKYLGKIDVVFPVLHGPYGEDGTIQGLLKYLNIPYVGAGVLGSALGMDKDVMKRLLKEDNLPVSKFLVFNSYKKARISFDDISKKLLMPFFIKPANLGSSIGVSKIKRKEDFIPSLKLAFSYDNKILCEELIDGREIECSVLGNENPIASIPGEILVRSEFYTYEAKYIDENASSLVIPADLPASMVRQIQKLSIQAFKTLCCEGMARVDFFLRENNSLYINEINTIPGFTKISMYPKLWEKSGISYPNLIDKLIQFALERHNNEKRLRISIE